MTKITYSSDIGILTLKDNIQSGKLAEKYFEMKEDLNQIPATRENVKWINKNIPECVNIIKNNKKIIGFTFIIPSNKKLMNKFILKKINENQMFEEIKKSINYFNFDTIYLCSAFVKPEYRKRGLALEGFMKSIEILKDKRKIKPILFYWAYTKEGGKMCKRLAKKVRLKSKMRKN